MSNTPPLDGPGLTATIPHERILTAPVPALNRVNQSGLSAPVLVSFAHHVRPSLNAPIYGEADRSLAPGSDGLDFTGPTSGGLDETHHLPDILHTLHSP